MTRSTPTGGVAVKERPAGPEESPLPLGDARALGQYRIHPAANLFPMMSPEGLRQMADDIREHGLQESVWMYDGQVLDGRNRLVACDMAGVKPTFQPWTPRNDGDTPFTFVWSKNGPRRHLTTSQRATIAVRMAEQIREEHARLREADRMARAAARAAQSPFSDAESAVDSPVGAPRTPGTALQFTGGATAAQPIPQTGRPGSPFGVPAPAEPAVPARQRYGKAREQAAAALGVSPAYVNDAQDLQKADPAVFEAVAAGELSLPAAQERVIREAQAAGRLDQVTLRPGVMSKVLEGLEAKKAKNAPKPRITLKKFGKVESSRTTVQVVMTGGNPAVIEEYLNRMQDDPKVIEMTYEVVEEKRKRGGRR